MEIGVECRRAHPHPGTKETPGCPASLPSQVEAELMDMPREGRGAPHARPILLVKGPQREGAEVTLEKPYIGFRS